MLPENRRLRQSAPDTVPARPSAATAMFSFRNASTAAVCLGGNPWSEDRKLFSDKNLCRNELRHVLPRLLLFGSTRVAER